MSDPGNIAASMAGRVVQLNSMLTGGGTDEQWLRLCAGLHSAKVPMLAVGPAGREYSRKALELGFPFRITPPEGPLKLRFILSAAKAIRDLKATIVHAHHGRDYWPAILAIRLSGRTPKLVLSRHLAKSPGSWLSKKYLLSFTDALVCVSQFTADVLRNGHRDQVSPEVERHWRPPTRGDFSKVHVIHPGLDTRLFCPRPDQESVKQRAAWGMSETDYIFAVVGGYGAPRGKGQREFLRAAAQIAKTFPAAKFLIIGRGSLQETLLRDIAELGLQGAASLPDYSTDMPGVMNAIDCLVHPQIGTESFGLVVAEAHACGKPVIAARLDGIPEAFACGGCGELVPSENVAALADAMARWAVKPRLSWDERAHLHEAVRQNASLERMVERHRELYGQLLVERTTRTS